MTSDLRFQIFSAYDMNHKIVSHFPLLEGEVELWQ